MGDCILAPGRRRSSTKNVLAWTPGGADHRGMISYGQFCPVAKTAEVFGDRWTPIIMRELCFGARGFGELLAAAPLISRTVLAQRLKELAQAGVVYIEAKPKGKGRGHLYGLTSAGEDFRPIVELMSVWGQCWGQGLIGPDDLDPKMLVWGMRRQIDPGEIPAHGFVIRFEFRGLPKTDRSPRYWWLVLRPDDIEVCLKAPVREVDAVIAADLMTFTKVWLGYLGLLPALESGAISLHGAPRALRTARRLLALPDQPMVKSFRFSRFAPAAAVAAE
jgi:DNA-binding HxlR family transcriptional regulator